VSPPNTFTTGVPNNLNRPQTFHVFNFLRAGGSLVNVPLTIALIGTKRSTGTAVPGVIYDATNAAATDALGGVSSEGALMARQAYACAQFFDRGPIVKITFVAEPGGGVANVKTITCVGAATSDGNIIIRVAGRTFLVGVSSGQAQNTIAANVAAELNKKAEQLPVLITVATNVVTLTHATKGVNGGDVQVSVDQQVAGCVATVANTVAGTGVADHQPAIDALAPNRYEGIAFANHAAADITEILTDINVRWSSSSKTWGWYFIGEPGTIGTATALAAAANHRSVLIQNVEGCLSTPPEMAVTGAMLAFSRERPNAGYNGATVPLYPPNAATIYTGPEVEAAILAGLTVYTAVKDATGQNSTTLMRCERMVTTKTVSSGPSGNVIDDLNRDLAVSRTGVALAIQLDIAANAALGPDTNPDGIGQNTNSDNLIRDLASAILRAEARAGVLNADFVEDDVANILVEHDNSTLGRDNARIPYHPVTPLGQVAWVHDVIIGA
jgi:phage tail sheath gpL-like